MKQILKNNCSEGRKLKIRAMHSAQPVLEQFLLTKVLPHIGEMGVYQITLFMLLCIPATLPAAFLAFNQVGIVVKKKCATMFKCVCASVGLTLTLASS